MSIIGKLVKTKKLNGSLIKYGRRGCFTFGVNKNVLKLDYDDSFKIMQT